MKNYFVFELAEFGSDTEVIQTEKSPQEIFDERRFRKGASLFDLFIAEITKTTLTEDETDEVMDAVMEDGKHPLITESFVSSFTLEKIT
jgi:hypothetical protein